MKKFLKKAVAVVMMAAAVVATVPGLAQAGTYPTKDCPGNTSTGYHNYRYYCIGFCEAYSGTHTYYKGLDVIFKKNPLDCSYTLAYHGSRESCEYCGRFTGVTSKHCDNEFHKSCGKGNIDHGVCNGIGSDVTVLAQY